MKMLRRKIQSSRRHVYSIEKVAKGIFSRFFAILLVARLVINKKSSFKKKLLMIGKLGEAEPTANRTRVVFNRKLEFLD